LVLKVVATLTTLVVRLLAYLRSSVSN
jgi:hypothetical protein